MAITPDRLSSIPVHISTIRLLQSLKTGAQNWDEFLLSGFEDLLPAEVRKELSRRERVEWSSTFRQIERRRVKVRSR